MRRRWPSLALGGLVMVAILAATPGCGGTPPPPKRGVIEKDVDAWKFRRFQEVLDIEVWVPKNKAVAFTASYAYSEALKRGRIEDKDVINVFVTRYERDAGIQRALVKFARRLAQESGYVVDETKLKGTRVIRVTGHGEAWALWASDKHVVKVGGRGHETIPGSVVKKYAHRYPSRLASGALEGPLPPGQDEPKKKKEPYDKDNPRPDWDKYGKKR